MSCKTNKMKNAMLNQIVISTATQEVLAFFCLNPDQEFHEREVARRVNRSPAATHVAVMALAQEKVLHSHRRGRMVFYRLNEARSLVRPYKILAAVFALEPLLVRLQGITDQVILYGSCATGKYLTSSDVDLLIITSHEEEVFDAVSDFGRDFPKEIRPVLVSLAEWMDYEEKNPVFYGEVNKGLLLYQSERYESKL
jgi:hypothetical protein